MAFEYGCLPPISGEEAAVDEMRKRNAFWNALVEIERTCREKATAILRPEEDAVAPLFERLEALRAEIKAKRGAARSSKVDVDELVKEAATTKAAIASALETARAARKERIAAAKPMLDALESERRAAVKEAQRASGLYWCNYGEVLDQYAIARGRAMREGSQLRFHRWDGSGKLTVRYQQGLPASQVFGEDTRLQIDPVPETAWTSPIRAERRRLARTKVRIRVRSDERRAPVWLELPMVMHRPLPPDGVIRMASAVRERVGRSFRWKLVVTVTLAQQPQAPTRRDGTIAVDIGWRAVHDGLRVAYWCDTSGAEGELVLGPEIVEPLLKLHDLRSIRDKHFNDVVTMLRAWLVEHAELVPNWLRDQTANIAAWRSQGRMVSLIRRWRAARFAGDEEIVGTLEGWLRRENHLYDWEANQRDQVQRRRREEYRKFAAALARKYDTIILEAFDLRRVARKPAPESGTRGSTPADKQRTIAATSELRGAISNAALRENARIVTVPADASTMECHACGHVEQFDSAARLVHRCGSCGALWDQDANAARVLLKRGMLISSVSGPSSRGS